MILVTDEDYYNELSTFYHNPHQNINNSNYFNQYTTFNQQQTIKSEIKSTKSLNNKTTNQIEKLLPEHHRSLGSLSGSGSIHLWHFIKELLDQPKEYSSCVRWVNRQEGTY